MDAVGNFVFCIFGILIVNYRVYIVRGIVLNYLLKPEAWIFVVFRKFFRLLVQWESTKVRFENKTIIL